MTRRLLAALLTAALLFTSGAAGAAVSGYNGAGSVTRPANITAYTASKLFAANTSGTAVATNVTVNGTLPGPNIIVGARLYTTGTGATAAAFKVHLFAPGATPTLTGLADQSGYVGPYGADMGGYLGVLTCGSLTATNDGTAQYWTDCTFAAGYVGGIRFTGLGGSAGGAGGTQTVIPAVFEVSTGYTPISGEVLTLYLATRPVSN